MPTSYAQKQSPAQKKDASSASSILDSSSQSESLQRKADMANNAAQRAEAPRPNNTGMPDNLKSGIESLSGFLMDDVRVHYNSSKPATVQALAYTQGTDIHVAPGQEKHLPHEAWHVAQQMAGRVSPTTNINGMPVNDNAALEHEADVMGEKAVSQRKEFSDFINKKISCTDIAGIQRFPASQPTGYRVQGSWVSGCTILRQDPVYDGTVNSLHDQHDEKVKALQAISAEAGNLGNSTRVGGTCALAVNESFFAVIPAKYKTSKGSSVDLTLTYNFRNGNAPGGDVGGPGYITQVSRKRTKGKADYTKTANMVTPPRRGPLPLLNEGTYYNVHNVHERTPLGLDIPTVLNETSSSGGDFTGLAPDSYTKLAGEGARFLCVRNNMARIKDNTVIWDTSGYGVMFSDLWKSWAWSFDKKFNISDDEIKTAFGEKEIGAYVKPNTIVKIGDDPAQKAEENQDGFIDIDTTNIEVPANKAVPEHYTSNQVKKKEGYLVIKKEIKENPIERANYLNRIELTKK